MPNPKDYKELIGKSFNKLTVVEIMPHVPFEKRRCRCLCECGNDKYTTKINSLTNNALISCGCHKASRLLNIKVGDKFGRLKVIKPTTKNQHGALRFICKCECGNKLKAIGRHLIIGNTNSCGCLRKDLLTTHNNAGRNNKSKTYNSWRAMKKRCYSVNQKEYKRYGAVGVKVCKRWKHSFENFLADMGERPRGKTIDRIDPFGNYTPKNCRWATPIKQGNNKRYNVEIIYKGKLMTLSHACRKANPTANKKYYGKIYNRYLRGWRDEDLFD